MKLKRVLVLLANGFEEIEAVTVIDLLRRAEIEVVSAALKSQTVTGAHGIPVLADALLHETATDDFDMIVLPGGQPGTRNLGESTQVIELLQEFSHSGRYVAAICAAPMVLAKANLLNGVEAVCYPGCEAGMEQAIMVDDDVCCSGKLVTSKGPATAMSFGLTLIELLKGKTVSDQVRRDLLY